jgi:hypothetical protein
MAGNGVVRSVLSIDMPACFHSDPFWRSPMYDHCVEAGYVLKSMSGRFLPGSTG